jgi:hypothetical protein
VVDQPQTAEKAQAIRNTNQGIEDLKKPHRKNYRVEIAHRGPELPSNTANRPIITQDSAVFFGTFCGRNRNALPSRRPLDVLFGRLHPEMESGFILITSWYFKLYGILKPGDEARRGKAGNASVKPWLVDCHCVFVCHNYFTASAMPS